MSLTKGFRGLHLPPYTGTPRSYDVEFEAADECILSTEKDGSAGEITLMDAAHEWPHFLKMAVSFKALPLTQIFMASENVNGLPTGLVQFQNSAHYDQESALFLPQVVAGVHVQEEALLSDLPQDITHNKTAETLHTIHFPLPNSVHTICHRQHLGDNLWEVSTTGYAHNTLPLIPHGGLFYAGLPLSRVGPLFARLKTIENNQSVLSLKSYADLAAEGIVAPQGGFHHQAHYTYPLNFSSERGLSVLGHILAGKIQFSIQHKDGMQCIYTSVSVLEHDPQGTAATLLFQPQPTLQETL